jgi:hypothetical protein
MRVLMGVIEGKNGVYYARRKVPKKLEETDARVLAADRPRVSWLKRSLRTKDKREANIRAKPVLIEFDSIVAKAEALLHAAPVRSDLSEHEIERIADYHYAAMLAEDDDIRRDGTDSEDVFQAITQQLLQAGVDFKTPFIIGPKPAFGLSDREATKLSETIQTMLPVGRDTRSQRAISRMSGRP